MIKQKIQASLALILILSFFQTSFAGAIKDDAEKVDKTTFVGMKKSRTGKILDDFKDREKELIFESVPFSSEDEAIIFDKESRLNSLEDIVSRLEDTKEQYKEKKKEVTREKLTLKSYIAQIDANIEEAEQAIKDTKDLISTTNQKIAEYMQNIMDLETKISTNKASLLEYLSYIYSKGDMVYGEDNELDVVRSIILNDGNLSDIINDIHFKSIIEVTGQNFVEIHRGLVREYYYNKESLKKEKIDNLRFKAELEQKITELDTEKMYKEQLLEETKNQEALFNQYIAARQAKVEQAQQRFSEINNDYSTAYATIGKKYNCPSFEPGKDILDDSIITLAKADSANKCTQIKLFYYLEQKLRSFDLNPGQNKLSWPLNPEKGISTYFRDPDYESALGSGHDAIDIRVSQGTDIVAPAAGYVYFVNEPTQGGYGYMALKHPEGFVTVYGHISEVLVSKYDYVQAGQVIAKSGGAPGTPGAGPMTSGPHLHFELFQNREPIDPLRYLDVTALTYKTLDSKYKFKYIEDLRAKYGNQVNLSRFQGAFVIKGATEMERQKNLLAKYATPDFQNWNTWVEESISGNIDPSFTMCVGLAETGLGKHLKTAYNVGNIGNTDSGSTYEFADAREGIYWMIKTLNNKFLGKYKTIDMLSRWGNKKGSIYASSDDHWHNNVVRCLSTLKGTYIPDNFEFRIK